MARVFRGTIAFQATTGRPSGLRAVCTNEGAQAERAPQRASAGAHIGGSSVQSYKGKVMEGSRCGFPGMTGGTSPWMVRRVRRRIDVCTWQLSCQA